MVGDLALDFHSAPKTEVYHKENTKFGTVEQGLLILALILKTNGFKNRLGDKSAESF